MEHFEPSYVFSQFRIEPTLKKIKEVLTCKECGKFDPKNKHQNNKEECIIYKVIES